MFHHRVCPNGLAELNSLPLAVTKKVGTASRVREIKVPSILFTDKHRLVNFAHLESFASGIVPLVTSTRGFEQLQPVHGKWDWCVRLAGMSRSTPAECLSPAGY
jgi:hypothetical protein